MQLFIRTLAGEVLTIDAAPSTSIMRIKTAIHMKEGKPCPRFVWISLEVPSLGPAPVSQLLVSPTKIAVTGVNEVAS